MKVRTIKASVLKRMAKQKSWGWDTVELSAEATAEVSDPANWQIEYRQLQDQLKEEIKRGMETQSQRLSWLRSLLKNESTGST